MVLKKLEGHGGGFRDLSEEGMIFEIWRKIYRDDFAGKLSREGFVCFWKWNVRWLSC